MKSPGEDDGTFDGTVEETVDDVSDEPSIVNVWVDKQVMTATKIAAILNSQTPSQLMEDILVDYLDGAGFLVDRDQIK